MKVTIPVTIDLASLDLADKREPNKSGLLKATIPSRPVHLENPEGAGGLTIWKTDSKEAMRIETPPDPVIRVHEVMHTKHTDPGIVWGKGKNNFVHNVIEDMRLHMFHWPWPKGETPSIIDEAGKAQLVSENKKNADILAKEDETMDAEMRGKAFALALRNCIALEALNVYGTASYPDWFSVGEYRLATELRAFIQSGLFDHAADILERAYFSSKKEEEKEEGRSEREDDDECEDGDDSDDEENEEDDEEEERIKEKKEEMRREATEDDDYSHREKDESADFTLDDQGPFIDPCGDPSEGWARTTMGSRIHRPSLRKPVLPQRLFLRKRPVLPGGTIIIDASGSMNLTPDDLIKIIDKSPMATLAIYYGNDGRSKRGRDAKPAGMVRVLAKDGFRRSREDIIKIVGEKLNGNSVDLEAVEWLLEQPSPRTMVTDRGFCGCGQTAIALAHTKLNEAERTGEITVINDGHKLTEEAEECEC